MNSRTLWHGLLSISLSVVVSTLQPNRADAQSTEPAAACESEARAVQNLRSRIDVARKLLSEAEMRCAFADYNVGRLGPVCRTIQKEAFTDLEKRRAWSDAVVAWDALDRTLLILRQTEDRLGVECIAR